MTDTIPVIDWVNHIDGEYLSTFVRDGGAAVKFAVATEEAKRVLSETVKARCEERNYLFLTLDAAASRVHMPQDVFFQLASQIEWRLLARHVILRLLAEKAYRTGDIDPNGSTNIIGAVARANGIEPNSILYALRPALEQEVTKNPNLARAFRVAMTHLSIKETENAAPGSYAGQPLIDWLTGANSLIGNVKHFQIHTPINRTTARYFIESALRWVRQAGYSGTVILLDNSRVLLSRNPKDGMRYYTRAMTIDHYELLREFIDDAEKLPGSLLIVATDYAFVDEYARRGWSIYQALRTRVMDDVRDRNVPNPAAALVRLS